MSVTLNLANFSKNNILEYAKVAVDASKGAATFKIDNPQNFAINDYLLIGRQGGAQSKIYQVQSVSDDTVTLTTTLSFFTERGTEIIKLFGSKLKVYRAPYVVGATPLDANFSLVTNGLVDIDPDQLATQFTDPDGDDHWYKYTFYNITTAGETPLHSSEARRDTSSSNYASLEDVRREAGFAGNNNVTDDLVYRKLTAAQSKINGMLSGRYVLPLGQPVNAIIADLTVRLAAGYVMIAEYGAFDGQDKTKGEKLRDDALNELKAYQDGSQVITDLQAVSVVIADSGGFESGFSSDNPLGFSRDDIVGYNERVY